MPSCRTKTLCFLVGRRFVSPSAVISVVLTYLTINRLAWTSCLIQSWCISIWRSFVWNTDFSRFSRSTVCLLSQFNVSGWSVSNWINKKRRFIQYSYLAAWLIASNSASVVDVVIVFYLRDFQSISLPNRLKINPLELLRSGLLAKLVSEAAVKIVALGWLSKQRERYLVPYR